jgi:predicted membrane channel-forming protein YqfA (hemolysin III family)
MNIFLVFLGITASSATCGVAYYFSVPSSYRKAELKKNKLLRIFSLVAMIAMGIVTAMQIKGLSTAGDSKFVYLAVAASVAYCGVGIPIMLVAKREKRKRL